MILYLPKGMKVVSVLGSKRTDEFKKENKTNKQTTKKQSQNHTVERAMKTRQSEVEIQPSHILAIDVFWIFTSLL